jgi:hypothetical protein
MTYMNQGVCAKKSFFLLDHNDDLYDTIGDDFFLISKIVAIPRKGVSIFKLIWDTSSL